MHADPNQELYKQLKRWPRRGFKPAGFSGRLDRELDFDLKYLGEHLSHKGMDCIVIKANDLKPYRDLCAQPLVSVDIWAWATPTWSVVECLIPLADDGGALRSIYSPFDPLIMGLLRGDAVGMALVSSSGEYCIFHQALDDLVTSTHDDLDRRVLKSFLSWTERETQLVFRHLPIEVTFFDYLLYRQGLKKNAEPISRSQKLSLSWATSYKFHWETFFKDLSESREMLQSNKRLLELWADLKSKAEGTFPEFLQFSEIFESDLSAEKVVKVYEEEPHAALVLCLKVANLIEDISLNELTDDEFRRHIVGLLRLLFSLSNSSPSVTRVGRRRVFWTSGCSIDESKQITVDIDHDFVGQHSAYYWADIIEQELSLGEILTGRDVPLSRIKASKWIQEVKCDLPTDQIVQRAKANVAEIRFAKKWTIPWGARVEVRFGNFRYLEVYDMGGEFITLFRDINEHYLMLSFQPDQDVPWATAPLAFFEEKGSPENLQGQALLFLVASSAVRDFCVVEEREGLFSSRTQSLSKAQRHRSMDSEEVIYIPKVRYRRLIEDSLLSSAQSDEATHSRALHEVKAHLRKAEKASVHQIVLASRYGIHIPRGYTFVRPHQRGGYEDEYVEKKRIYRSRSVSKMLFEESETRSSADCMPDWFKFERDTERIFEGFGWEVLERKPNKGRGDGGVDVLAFDPKEEVLWLAQCKCYSKTVIQPDKIRELIGTLAVQREAVSCKGMFLTTSTFSSGAAQLAEAEGIELVDGARFSKFLEALVS